jgi:hypothetical protein
VGNKKLLWVGLIPLLLMFWLGAQALNADPIWIDEYMSLLDAGGIDGPRSIPAIWNGLAGRNPWHAPGYFILLSNWAALTGWHPLTLRLLSLLFGLLAVAWTYRLGRDFATPRVGLAAAGVLSTSAFFIHYTHELRMYTLFLALTAFTTWVYLSLARGRKSNPFMWAGLILGAAGMLYTHYFTALPLMAVGVLHLTRFHPSPKSRWARITAALILAAVLFLPWTHTLIAGLQVHNDDDGLHARALSADEILGQLLYYFGNGGVLLLIVALIFASAAVIQNRRGARVIAYFAVMVPALVILLNATLNIMHAGRIRYLNSAWIYLALLAGLGIGYAGDVVAELESRVKRRRTDTIMIFNPLMRKKEAVCCRGGSRPALTRQTPYLIVKQHCRLPTITFAILLGIWILNGIGSSTSPAFIAGLDGAGYTYPVHRVARDLRFRVQPDDFVVNVLPDDLYAWMYYERNAQFYLNRLPVHYATLGLETDSERQPEQQPQIRASIGDSPRVWLAYLDAPAPAARTEFSARLGDRYDLCGTVTTNHHLNFDLYAQSPACCSPETSARPPLIHYQNELALSGIEVMPPDENGTLRVLLGWAGANTIPAYQYSTALHLVDETGALVAQSDNGLPLEPFLCRRETIPLDDVPPGSYTLALIVYDWQTGDRLTGTIIETGESGDRLRLQTVNFP